MIPQYFLPVVKKHLGTHYYCIPCFPCGVPRQPQPSAEANSHPRVGRQCLLQVQKQEADASTCHLHIGNIPAPFLRVPPGRKYDCYIRSLSIPKPTVTAPFSLTTPTPTLYYLRGILVASMFSPWKKDLWSNESGECCIPHASLGYSQCTLPYLSLWEVLQKRSMTDFMNPEFPQLSKNRIPFPNRIL